ncbi:MAG: DUF362 domain-containing protein [Terriglobia bacterium]
MGGTLCTRRHAICAVSAAAVGWWLAPIGFALGGKAPRTSVAVGTCPTYGSEVHSTLKTMFDQLGGLQKLVRGKTVAIKLNLTGSTNERVENMPLGLTHWVHPQVIGATVHLLGQAGARRIRLLESPWSTAEPLEEFMRQANWNPADFVSAAPGVEFENTNYLGKGSKYSRFMVPHGGLMYRGYDLNHSYADCDVFVSLAKLKEHATAGVTLTTKNCFGITPCTIYGEGAGKDEPSLLPRGGRSLIHNGHRLASLNAPPLVNPQCSRDPGYRVPRTAADLVAARPVHLAIIDGIQTITGGEGPWISDCKPVHPGVLIAGRNCVSTDAVAASVMGFNPMADRGTAPFENCDSTLRLAERLGVGTPDLARIEVLGTPISKVRFKFRNA